MILYDYFRSSASFRVRIALNIKEINYENRAISLVDNQHLEPYYLALNPQALVPALEENGHLLTQSLAIIEYLEDIYPFPSLMPQNKLERALVKSLALYIACDMHPLNNLRVRTYLKNQCHLDETETHLWVLHWLHEGFQHLEAQLQRSSDGQFCFGTQPTLADVCLIPQVYSAMRFECPIEAYPLIRSIHTHCMSIPAFQLASPSQEKT